MPLGRARESQLAHDAIVFPFVTSNPHPAIATGERFVGFPAMRRSRFTSGDHALAPATYYSAPKRDEPGAVRWCVSQAVAEALITPARSGVRRGRSSSSVAPAPARRRERLNEALLPELEPRATSPDSNEKSVALICSAVVQVHCDLRLPVTYDCLQG